MSDSRLGALAAILLAMPAGIRWLAGLARSMAPMVNCVIFDSAPVGVHEVSAIEFVQMTVSTMISGREMKVSSHGTSKKAWGAQAPSTLNTGTPTHDTHSGTSMCASTSLRSVAGVSPLRVRSDLNALVKISG